MARALFFHFRIYFRLIDLQALCATKAHAYYYNIKHCSFHVEIDNKQNTAAKFSQEVEEMRRTATVAATKYCWTNIETKIIIHIGMWVCMGCSSFEDAIGSSEFCKWTFNALKRHRWDSAVIKMEHFSYPCSQRSMSVRMASFIDSSSEVFILFILFLCFCFSCALLCCLYQNYVFNQICCWFSRTHSSGIHRKIRNQIKNSLKAFKPFFTSYDFQMLSTLH